MNEVNRILVSLLQGEELIIKSLPGETTIVTLEKDLLELLRWNRLVPYFYHSLISQQSESYFTAFFVDELKKDYQESILQNMRMEGVFRKIIPLLQENEINPIILKGAYLCRHIYDDPSLRPMSDIDILVEKQEVAKTRTLLFQAGCISLYESESRFTSGNWPHTPPLLYQGFLIEIHHHLFPADKEFLLSSELIKEHALPVDLFGEKCLTLSAEHQFFFLIYHLHKHAQNGYLRMIWMLDIRLFWEKNKDTMDLEQIMQLIEKSNLTGALCAISSLLNLDVSLPSHALNTDVKEITEMYFRLSHPATRITVRLKSVAALRDAQGIKNKTLFVTGKLFPAPAFIRKKYSIKHKIWLIPGYFLLYKDYLSKLGKVLFTRLFKTSP